MDGDVVGSSLLPCSGEKQTAKFVRARRLQSDSTQLRPKAATWELDATKELFPWSQNEVGCAGALVMCVSR